VGEDREEGEMIGGLANEIAHDERRVLAAEAEAGGHRDLDGISRAVFRT